ncbi:MAG: VC0807 family protein [Ilumatobacteraceae bacterium]
MPLPTTSVASTEGWRLHPTKFSVVLAVVRRLVPFLIEATLIPTVLFYIFFASLGLFWAFIASSCWAFACVAHRLLHGHTVPAFLVLACVGIGIRTGIYIWSNNPFIYFLQPVLRTLLTAGAFALSVVIGRPLIARFADDFCPLDVEVQRRPGITQLFRRLTYQWAFVNLALAAVSLSLLWTVSTAVFVGATTVATWVITTTGVCVTVSAAVSTARTEGLTTAVAPNGRLRAYTLPVG